MPRDRYETPFAQRYASDEMLFVFSDEYKYTTWRRLWVALAKALKELGLEITDEQIRELESKVNDVDFELARKHEERTKHEIMAHIHAYGEQCPNARPIIHLGATSAFVTDNTDVIQLRDALTLVQKKLVNVISAFAKLARKYKDTPTVGYTHFQPAQLTTVGKRISMWLYDFIVDMRELEAALDEMRFLGCKGAVGTQASYLELLGDEKKVQRLDEITAREFGFADAFPVTGQTYPRKIDMRISAVLASIAQSASKMANDIRLLQHTGEMSEPFEKEQVGSSAMPYKQNPMKCERICSIARWILANHQNQSFTAATQWLERTLDDSAGKRIGMAQAFLAADSVLILALDVASRLRVNENEIGRRVEEHFPRILTETLLMRGVSAGGDRQEIHERIRKLSVNKNSNDLLKTLRKDALFKVLLRKNPQILNPERFTGRAASQVGEFLKNEVQPLLKKYEGQLGLKVTVKV